MAPAPLYKRYIPPKQSAPQVSDIAPRLRAEEAVADLTDLKRKRERTQDEIAERKTKKLKKKAPVSDNPLTSHDSHTDNSIEDITDGQQIVANEGEFGQIKSVKKRHKLEKEARRVRKERERSTKADTLPTEETVPIRDVVTEKVSVKRSKKNSDGPNGIPAEIENARSTGTTELGLEEEVKSYDHTLSQPKKRRHRLEGVLAGATAEGVKAVPELDDENARKHAGVLSKFQKSIQSSVARPSNKVQVEKPAQPENVVKELRLPEKEPTPEFVPDDSALPSWLARPTIVSSEDKASFTELGLDVDTVKHLSGLGFRNALPVQQALLPLLLPPNVKGSCFLPGTEPVLPDLAVGAPTGSGKTLAYLVPIYESLRQVLVANGRLSALIIVPTRELVVQVAAVAESLVKGSGIKVGMATGIGRFKDEQEKLVRRGRRYDPDAYKELMVEANRRIRPSAEDSEHSDAYIDKLNLGDAKTTQRIHDAIESLTQHVPTYDSAVDILVATPGRLLEHVNSTLGFNLVHLQWLVIDEADKLLDNEYEGFLEALMSELERERTIEEQDELERYRRSHGIFRKRRKLRKVVLSATMTRDISKLTSLKLSWPQMVIVRGLEATVADTAGIALESGASGIKKTSNGFELPSHLLEYCVPVGDGSEKPLVALQLLRQLFERDHADNNFKALRRNSNEADDDDNSTNSESDASSSLSSDDSASTSGASSIVSDNGEELDESLAECPELDVQDVSYRTDSILSGLGRKVPPLTATREQAATAAAAPTVLIFTSSTQSAARLSHLLSHLQPTWAPWLTTLVKSKKSSPRLRSSPTDPAVVISTDRAARGLDHLGNRTITHVLQYDVPTSVTSYVHRVGRTARAGRSGEAWTLYTHTEARWFVNEIIKASGEIKRRGTVERTKIFMKDEKLRERFREVLEEMKDEVIAGRK